MPSLAYGEYKLSVSFIGYNNLDTTFRVSAPKLNLGVLKLKPGVQIETVVKEAKALRTSQKGDTVSYNAGAFKVVADADVEGLLKKMPGITVTDGTVEAQGETVKKIFVDGKEFFGEDVTTAIKSLPAEAVDRVEVYNKLSDAAELSGHGRRRGLQGAQHRHPSGHAAGAVRQALCRIRIRCRHRNRGQIQIHRRRQCRHIPRRQPHFAHRAVQQRQPAEFLVRGHSGRFGQRRRRTPRQRGPVHDASAERRGDGQRHRHQLLRLRGASATR